MEGINWDGVNDKINGRKRGKYNVGNSEWKIGRGEEWKYMVMDVIR